MKRSVTNSDSFGAFMSICPTSTDDPIDSHVFTREFNTMLDTFEEEVCFEESNGHVSDKKRRLGIDQVKALEKNFEIENKLEPERKLKLAKELGLQPRQVAIWFQNRRARSKTKQLEKDYEALKARYDSLKIEFESVHKDKSALLKEVRELKSKLNQDCTGQEQYSLIEEEMIASPLEGIEPELPNIECERSMLADMKDGLSDSDSSAVLNEEQSQIVSNPPSIGGLLIGSYQPQFVKTEEHDFLGVEDSCNFLNDEQAPSLQWYCLDTWS